MRMQDTEAPKICAPAGNPLNDINFDSHSLILSESHTLNTLNIIKYMFNMEYFK